MFRGYCEVEQKDKWERIEEFKKLLKENNVKYIKTKTTNIVEVLYKNNKALLSLVPSRSFKTIKVKINNKWIRKTISKLIIDLS